MMKLSVRAHAIVLAWMFTQVLSDTRGAETGVNFLGSVREETFRKVPDTSGAVGEDHVVVLVHSVYKVWNKHDLRIDDELPVGDRICAPTANNEHNVTCLPVAELDLHTFWNSALPQDQRLTTIDFFDPRVIYDPYEERYIAVSSYDPGDANDFLVAVSNSSNPLDGWKAHRIDSDSDDDRWVDFPTVGVNRDAVIMVGNMKPARSMITENVSVLAIDKDALYSDELTTGDYKLFGAVESVTGRLPHPVMDLDNGTFPASLLTAETDGSGDDSVKRTVVTGIAANDSVQFEKDIDLDDLDPGPNGDQPDSVDPLFNINGPDSSIPPLLSSQPVKQDGHLWGVQGREHSASGNAAIRWFKLNSATDTLVKEDLITGVITDGNGQQVDHADLLFPSIAVNKLGNVVVGFTATSEDLNPSSYAAVGEVDGTNVKFDEIQPMQVGNGTWDAQNSQTNHNSWGDYSATVVDPVNPLRFWTFQELVNADQQWGVQVTEIVIRDNLIGDMDFDGDVDLDDVDPFVLALSEPENYYDQFGAKRFVHGDIDDDGDLDADDVDPFVDLLTGGGGSGATSRLVNHSMHAVPEPSSLLLAIVTLTAGWTRAGRSRRRG